MDNDATWIGQDALKLSVDEWNSLLDNSSIFDSDAMALIQFVYLQPLKQSTASDIGRVLNNVSQQKVTALNRTIAKKIYDLYNEEPPPNSKGGKRYWNVIFDGLADAPLDHNKHFIWRLRNNLIHALDIRIGHTIAASSNKT